MQITYVVVMSLDGKITRGDESPIYTWTSKEDQEHFRQLISESKVVIMGSNTFIASREMILQRLSPKTLRVVMTHHPELYADIAVPGQLEFVNKTPIDLVVDLGARGYSEALFIGGSKLAASFLADKLINQLYLTIEPAIFGTGKPFVSCEKLYDIKLKFVSSQQLNEEGTLSLQYKVI